MRTNRLWEGALSYGSLPAGTREDPQRGRTSCDVRIHIQDQRKHPFQRSHPWPQTTKEQQGGTEFPSHTQEYDKGPFLTCKVNF